MHFPGLEKVMEFGENDQGHGKVMKLQLFSVLIYRPIFAASKNLE